MIRKNVSKITYNEYIQYINELLRQNNSLALDDIARKEKDLEFIDKCHLNLQLIINDDKIIFLNINIFFI